MPRVSVVIPAYNNADYIAQTVESVLAQTFADFELVISDHSSTDDTLAVIEPYRSDPRVRVVSTEPGGGAERNWRRVTELATGEFVKLVCGDDLLAPELLERQVAALDAEPKAVLAATARDIVDADGAVLIRARGYGASGRVGGAEAVRASVRAGTNLFGEPGCVLMRREVLARVGGWDGRFPYLIDQATYSRVLLEGDLVADERSGAAFRLNGGQWSVALAKSQSDQAKAFHHWLGEARPDVVSAADVRRGNRRAMVMAWARRAVYVLYARRMSPSNAR